AQVLRVVPEEAAQVHYLEALHLQDLYDFWTEPRVVVTAGTTSLSPVIPPPPGSPVDIMAPAFQLPVLKKTLTQVGLKFITMISDVGGLVAQEKAARDAARASGPLIIDWTSYHDNYETSIFRYKFEIILIKRNEVHSTTEVYSRYHTSPATSTITEALIDLFSVSINVLCRVEDVCQSYEGRTMKLLNLVRGGVPPAVVTFLVTKSDNYNNLLSNANYYVMPIINPDGYSYTFTNDVVDLLNSCVKCHQDRLWRQTRSPSNSFFGCREVGASNDPCSELYAGQVPCSEVEMRVVPPT
ncbi:Carboxypeptidase B-like 6, partial [Homarus americanus]